MSILFIDGFETEEKIQQNQNVIGSLPAYDVVVDTARSGYRSLKVMKSGADNQRYTQIQKFVDNTTNRLGVSFAVRFTRISDNNYYFFKMGTSNGRYIKLRTLGQNVALYCLNDAGTDEYLAQRPGYTITTNRWYVFEAEYINGTNDATFKVTWDYTINLIDFTHANIHLNENPNFFEFHTRTSDNYNNIFYIDDVYVFDNVSPDNTFLQCVSILPSRVVLEGWIGDFTSYGDIYKPIRVVKEMKGDTSTYYYSLTRNEIQMFEMENIPDIGNIIAVQSTYYLAKYDQYSSDVTVHVFWATDSTTYDIKEIILTDHEFNRFNYVYRHNPFTLQDWTRTDYNDMQMGLKLL